jgi:arylsulfatase A-like enzyme
LLLLPCSLGCSRSDGDESQGAALARGRNVAVIVIDTLRADRLPFYGAEKNTAPFLASIAEESLVFDSAWSTSSWTGPAMASLFTSTYPNEHGVVSIIRVFRNKPVAGQVNRISTELETLPVFMQGQGYRTFGISQNIHISGRLGFARGFDRFEFVPYRKGAGAPESLAVLRRWRDEVLSETPFFVYLHFMDPHFPYVRHMRWIEPHEQPPANPREDLAAYDSEIRYVDEHLREVFDLLGLYRNALVIVTTDHGEEFREHGGLQHGFKLYNELIRIPLLMYFSGGDGPRGRVTSDVSNIDVLPTLRRLLGARDSEQDSGRPLVDSTGRPVTGDRTLFAMRTNLAKLSAPRKRSVMDGGFKLIASEPDGEVEIYALDDDPGETRNLVDAEPAQRERLAALLEEQEAAARGRRTGLIFEFQPTEEEVKMLEEIGYAH